MKANEAEITSLISISRWAGIPSGPQEYLVAQKHHWC